MNKFKRKYVGIIVMTIMVIFLLGTMQTFALENDKTVTVHYHRFDAHYDEWNLWIWPDGKDGQSYRFTDSDAFGMKGTFVIPESADTNRIGFLLRRSTEGNEWAEKEFGDRFIEFDGDTKEIFLVQGDEQVYYDINKVDLSPKIQGAFMDGLREVTLTSNSKFDIDLKDIVIETKEKEKLATESVTVDEKAAYIKTKESFDLTKDYHVKVKGYDPQDIQFRKVFDSKAFNDAYYYAGDDLGANYTKEETTFKIWAPTADAVYLTLDSSEERAMEKGDQGVYSVTVKGDLHNQLYNYKVIFGEKEVIAVDPYAKGVTTNGKMGAVIDFSRLNPEGWDKNYQTNFTSAVDAIIYELHIRDLSIHESSGIKNKGKFLGLSEKNTKDPSGNLTGLSYIKDLGVTHIQLMPVYDFKTIDESSPEGQYNWGYDPQNYNALEGSYSTDPENPSVRIKEFKEMIQSIHEEGLKVTMDVVYNHVYDSMTMSFEKIVPGYFFRMDNQGNFANGSGCGNETASDRKMMQKFMVDSTTFLVNEYHLDGFRFDLMGLHDIDTMNAIRNAINEIDPSKIIIGEGWNMGNQLLPSLRANQKNAEEMPGIGHFNDTLRDGLKGSVFEQQEAGFVNGNYARVNDVKKGIVGGINYNGLIYDWGNIEPNQSVSYVEAHDNNTLYDKIKFTLPEASEETIKKMHLLSDSIVLTSQGISFIHAGQEFMRTKDGDHNSYKSPDHINWLDWDRRYENQDIVDYFKGLIVLRKDHPAFRMKSAEMIKKHLSFIDTKNSVIAYHLKDFANDDSWEDIVVIHNANTESEVINLPSQANWHVVVDGETAGTDIIKSLKEGEDRVTVDALSTMVLYKDDDIKANDSSTQIIYILLGIIVISGIMYLTRKDQ